MSKFASQQDYENIEAVEAEYPGAAMLTLLLLFVMLKWGWRINKASGSDRTDQVIWAVKEVLIYIGAIAAISAVGYLH